MIVFITGASAGIGMAAVKTFIEKGDTVIAASRRYPLLQSLQKKYGDRIYPLELDVRNKNSVDKALQSLPDSLREIDLLLNNAGLALGLDPAQKAALPDWEEMVDTNINGILFCTHAILPGMVERNRGHIVNMGSVAGEFPYPGGHVYGATKAFVHQFSMNLRSDLLGTAVRVTCIEPGMCSGTEFSTLRFKGDAEKASAVYKGVEALSAEDIAETVYWVASRPAHVNINVVSLMPVQQAFGPFAVNRQS